MEAKGEIVYKDVGLYMVVLVEELLLDIDQEEEEVGLEAEVELIPGAVEEELPIIQEPTKIIQLE